MIGVDTNVFVRFLIEGDNVDQRRIVLDLFETDDTIFIGHIVLAETVWLLLSSYQYPAEKVTAALVRAAESASVTFEEPGELFQLLANGELSVRQSADYLLASSNRRNGCARTMTFDRRAARDMPGMELLA